MVLLEVRNHESLRFVSAVPALWLSKEWLVEEWRKKGVGEEANGIFHLSNVLNVGQLYISVSHGSD